jgi:Ras GTPase-activating-like protein IQGAP2/3
LTLTVYILSGPKEREYLKDLLSPLVKPLIEKDGQSVLELDPLEIWHEIIKEEESKTGEKSILPYDIPREEAAKSQKVQTIFNARMEDLKGKTENFLQGIENGLETLPYGIRYVSSRMNSVLQEKFPKEPRENILKVIGNLVYYRYMNPAIVAPEGFDVINTLISPEARKVLAEISRVLQVITSLSVFKNENEYLKPLNEWVNKCSARFTKYLQNCKFYI